MVPNDAKTFLPLGLTELAPYLTYIPVHLVLEGIHRWQAGNKFDRGFLRIQLIRSDAFEAAWYCQSKSDKFSLKLEDSFATLPAGALRMFFA